MDAVAPGLPRAWQAKVGPKKLCGSRRAKRPRRAGQAIGGSQHPRYRIPGALAVRAGRQIPGVPEILAPRRSNRLAAEGEHIQRAKAMAKLRLGLCGHVILDQGQSKRALAVFMPASRPAWYTRLSATTTTAAIITRDGPVLRTNSRNLQSAVILVSNADIGTKPRGMHATGQMKMSGVRGSRQPVGDGVWGALSRTIPWQPGLGPAGASRTSWRSRICRRE